MGDEDIGELDTLVIQQFSGAVPAFAVAGGGLAARAFGTSSIGLAGGSLAFGHVS